MGRRALITGIFGQDAAYLSKHLLARGYHVIGQMQHGTAPRPARLVELGIERDVEIVEIDLFDVASLQSKLEILRPDELYNLAGPSSVAQSFDRPLVSFEVNAIAAARLLEAARCAIPGVRFFQASTSEMFGATSSSPQNEKTPFQPRSPYAVAKLFAHWQAVTYRTAYKLFVACGIMFNHESPLRRRQFVTRKISSGLVEIRHGRRDKISLGNLDVRRDWGFSGDYVDGMWRTLQHQTPDDYVFATARSNSVRAFVALAAEYLDIPLQWSGSGLAEIGIDRKTGRTIVDIDPAVFRPADVQDTLGDPRQALRELGWSATVDFPRLVAMMVTADERRLLENRSLE